MLTATPRSHLDHGITPDQLSYILFALEKNKAVMKVGPFGMFFIAEVELPRAFGVVPCALHGPVTGEPPVLEAEAFYATRGKRSNKSRLCRRLKTVSRTITAIVIGDEDSPGNQRIDTAFGGPLSPMEVDDPDNKDKAASEKFWAQHALTPNSFEVKAEGILLAKPNEVLNFVVPPEAAVVSEIHITLAKLSKDQRKALKDRVFMDAPEVQFEPGVVEIVRPDKRSWVRFVDAEGQKLLREYVLSLEIPDLDEYDREQRPYHVSLANLTGSKFDSVGDITPDRK